jgi:hypothetical protein
MFADVNSEELKKKINETISSMMGFFGSAADDATATATDEPDATPPPTQVIYRTDELNDHLSGLFQGKIGTFAKELAENISEDFQSLLGEDISETSTPKDIMFNLMKTPTRSAVS